MESWRGGGVYGTRIQIEMVRVIGIETLCPWSFKSSMSVLGQRRKGEEMSCYGNGRGGWGAPICTSRSGNDGELKGIREEVSSWLYVSFCSGVRVREWRRRRSS